MDIAVVGAGRVGTAIAVALRSAGHHIAAVSGRTATQARAARHLPGVPVLDATNAARTAPVVIVAVPDDDLEPVVNELAAEGAFRQGGWAVHVNGAAPLSALDAARVAGARRLGIHPLQTFPTVDDAVHQLRGAGMAVTADDPDGEAFGTALAHDVGCVPFVIADAARPLYHAAAVFASNYLIAISAIAARLLEIAGVPDPAAAMAPLQRATLGNVERSGPQAALTGPAVRGDVTTIGRNLEALRAAAPRDVEPYVSMCRVAIDLAVEAGRLSSADAGALKDVLDGWR